MRLAKIVGMLGLALALLAGCDAKADDPITGIKFDRGHGSMWGNQFYIEIRQEQIVTANYIPEGTADLVSVQNIPITPEQWEALTALLEQLPLEKARTNLSEKNKLDGGEYRRLTLIRESRKGEKEYTYRWPSGEKANELEALLEQLVKAAN